MSALVSVGESVIGRNEGTAKVGWQSRRRLLFALAAGAALAIVCAALVWRTAAPSGPPLPEYDVSIAGEPPGAGKVGLHVGRGRRDAFEIVLRPVTAASTKVVVYPFALTVGGEDPAPLDAKVTVLADGAVRIAGERRALEGVNGLRIVVGSPLDIGKFDDAMYRAKAGSSDRNVRVVSVVLVRD